MSILEKIHGHQDLVQLDAGDRIVLCQEIRDFLISRVSKTGGHVASNLGVVELTVAIETVYDTAKDRLVFDVGHQSYIHKLLTDRQADFDCLRMFGGMAGFPKPSESVCDSFVAGHASSSVSIALGMARARSLSKQEYDVVTMLGDGAATGGLAYEGLNDAAVSREPMVIILNDNAMSIDRNVGGMASHLRQLRIKEKYLGIKERYRRFILKAPGGKVIYRLTRGIKDRLRRMLIPTTIFESMGFTYLGPYDGHDVEGLISLLRIAKDMRRPVVVHVMTQKGKGYRPAEEHPKLFHGVGKFNPVTGEVDQKTGVTFSERFGSTLVELAQQDSRICAITAAMPGGTGLLDFKKKFPNRLFDVGIAEEHAVSMAGGLAKQGMIPVVALYSTFLQRAYDMILQDVCMLNLHVVFAIDRAGLVGEDGETHHGVFDVGFLRQAPGMMILCPTSVLELQQMLVWAVEEYNGPVALRYPRGTDRSYTDSAWDSLAAAGGKGVLSAHRTGDDVTIITYGTMLQNVMDAAEILAERGIQATVLRLLTVSPLPVDQIFTAMSAAPHFVVIEETCNQSGICQALAWEVARRDPRISVDGIDLGHNYVTHGSVTKLYEHYGLDSKAVADFVQEVLKNEK